MKFIVLLFIVTGAVLGVDDAFKEVPLHVGERDMKFNAENARIQSTINEWQRFAMWSDDVKLRRGARQALEEFRNWPDEIGDAVYQGHYVANIPLCQDESICLATYRRCLSELFEAHGFKVFTHDATRMRVGWK